MVPNLLALRWGCDSGVLSDCFHGLTSLVPPAKKRASLAFLGSEPGSQTRDQMKASRANVVGESVCSLFFAESKLWCVGKQRTLSEPGETDGEQWTDRAQSAVATCHGLADIFWVQRNFSSVLVFNNHSGGLFITSLGVSSQLC